MEILKEYNLSEEAIKKLIDEGWELKFVTMCYTHNNYNDEDGTCELYIFYKETVLCDCDDPDCIKKHSN